MESNNKGWRTGWDFSPPSLVLCGIIVAFTVYMIFFHK